MEIGLDLPYITSDLPGIGGRIRDKPDHFVVEEIPLYEPKGEGEHLYVNLTREGLTTRDMQRQLAILFGLRVDAVGFAGMKDKYARSTQTFSVTVGRVNADFVEGAVARIGSSLPVTVNWARLHKNKLKPGHLLGNKFTVIVTKLGLSQDEALGRAQVIADRLRESGVPNFFGSQRFGHYGNNVRRGLEIIRGQYRVSDRWLRRLLISSYQSYLCNRYLVHRLESGNFDRILTGDVAKRYATGGMFQVEDGVKEQPRYEAHEISFTAPIYGSEMWSATGPAGELEAEVLAEAGITLEQLEKAGVKGTRRLGRLLSSDLVENMAPQGLEIRFSLPKGAFATTVLREIMKVDLAYPPGISLTRKL